MTVRARLTIAACCAAMAAAALVVMPAASVQAEDPGEALARIYAENDFQTEMPQATPAAPAAATEDSRPQAEEESQPQNDVPPPWSPDPADDSLGEPVRVVGIAVGILILAIVLYIVVSAATGLRFRRDHTPEPRAATGKEEKAKAGETPPGRLDVADALARQGRHAEAIHTLLLTVIAALREDARNSGGVSTTVREIVRRAPLDGDPKGALTRLALTAELIHFGGRNATEERYRACLESARAVLAALPGRPA